MEHRVQIMHHHLRFYVDVNLGLKDETPPVIKLWLDDEDEASAVQTIPVVGDDK